MNDTGERCPINTGMGFNGEGNVAEVKAPLRSGLRPADDEGGSTFAVGKDGAYSPC